jgi:peptidoglycan/xylan/chitin deacetylase (PgdA/CDA1 family)
MDILEQYGLRGTFFIEVLAGHVVPETQLAEAYGDIARRGHDPQLHLHPVYNYYKLFCQGAISRDQLPLRMDLIGSLPLEKQLELLQEGSRLFRKYVGRDPVAFRAGCFGGSASTLAALSQHGFRYDSSFNAAFLGSSCLMDSGHPANTPWQSNKVWEIPITNFETGKCAASSRSTWARSAWRR